MTVRDTGPKPKAFNIEEETLANENYRTVVWTGKYLQVTLMSIPVGESIGLELHPETDQFIRLEGGKGQAVMGPSKNNLDFKQAVEDGWSVEVPAGTWHDVINTGDEPLKLYVVYSPVHHAKGITQKTSEQADKDEESGKDEPPKSSHQPHPEAEDKSA